MKTRFAAVTMAAAACLLLAGGCKSNDKTMASSGNEKPMANMSVNSTCPVSGKAVDPSAQTVSYKGKSVGFCCDGCPSKWAKMTDAEKDAFMKKCMAAK